MTTNYLTTAEVAARRRRTPQALVMERRRGQGPPFVQDGGRILYPEDELEAWLDNHRVDPSAQPKRAPRMHQSEAV